MEETRLRSCCGTHFASMENMAGKLKPLTAKKSQTIKIQQLERRIYITNPYSFTWHMPMRTIRAMTAPWPMWAACGIAIAMTPLHITGTPNTFFPPKRSRIQANMGYSPDHSLASKYSAQKVRCTHRFPFYSF